MTEWAMKRFWNAAEIVEAEDGWSVSLDGKPVRTPGKRPLAVPSHKMAEVIAGEWDAQQGLVDPRGMPMTRSANSAIDKVATQHAAVADLLADYGGSDLLCYRAEGPEGLVARQRDGWDPVLRWADEALGARLVVTTGVMPVAQDKNTLRTLAARVHELSAFQLTGFHDLVGLSGSLILAFAVIEGHLDVSEAWALSQIDETFQNEEWGVDDEAAAHRALKRNDFIHAERVWRLSLPDA